MNDVNNNPLVKKWRERYDSLPNELQQKIKEKEEIITQLKHGKKSRRYPEIGDVFSLITSDNVEINGIVINNNVKNINGDDLLVVALFKPKMDYKKELLERLSSNNLILPPQIVGPEYWTKGLFCTFDNYKNDIICDSYGFYSVGKHVFLDEYGKVMDNEPKLLSVFGVSTINGISIKLDTELIINKII